MYRPTMDICWEDIAAIGILADAEEDAGNYIVSQILRDIWEKNLFPQASQTSVIPSNTWEETFDWRVDEQYGPWCYVEPKIFKELWICPSIAYEQYIKLINIERLPWRSFLSVEEAYRALIDAALKVIKGESR